jgi:hypothetical protein
MSRFVVLAKQLRKDTFLDTCVSSSTGGTDSLERNFGRENVCFALL